MKPYRKPPTLHTVFVSSRKAEDNPPHFVLWIILALLLWPLGLVGTVVYLCRPETRNAGIAVFFVSLCSALVTHLILTR